MSCTPPLHHDRVTTRVDAMRAGADFNDDNAYLFYLIQLDSGCESICHCIDYLKRRHGWQRVTCQIPLVL